MKLKDVIIANFIPEEYARSIEKRANWNADEDCWTIQKLDLTGNKIRLLRSTSNPKMRRPETEYARQRYVQNILYLLFGFYLVRSA